MPSVFISVFPKGFDSIWGPLELKEHPKMERMRQDLKYK